MEDHRNPMRIVRLTIMIGLVIFSLALNLSRAVRADYSHDEDQFITSARLLLDEGLLPYRDYPYFHTPYLIFIYAVLFRLAGSYNLLAARIFSALCATACVVLVFWMVLHFFSHRPWRLRFLATVAIALLYLTNPLLAATAGFSWNHNLAVLCMLASLWLFLLAADKKTFLPWAIFSGMLLGIGVGVRLTSLTMLPAFLLAILWLPGKFSIKKASRLGLPFIIGFCLALLPMLWLFILAPGQFIFGNLEYAWLNTEYRLSVPIAYNGATPVFGPQTPLEKFGFLWLQVITQPVNLLLFAGFLFFGGLALVPRLRRSEEQGLRNILVFLALPFVAIGSFLPTPTWYQYFYAPLPFALLAIALGLVYLTTDPHQLVKWFYILLIQLALLSCVIAIPDFRRISFLRYTDLWKPLVIHQVGNQLRQQLGPGARIFTLAPLYPLEGGLRIYPQLATGVFAFRTGPLLSKTQTSLLGVISIENFAAYLDAQPPQALLVGFDQVLEAPVVQYAQNRGYRPTNIDGDLVLWVK